MSVTCQGYAERLEVHGDVCVNVLSLELLELGTRTGLLLRHLLLSQLLHLCLQGSQLLLQSLQDDKLLHTEPILRQYNTSNLQDNSIA